MFSGLSGSDSPKEWAEAIKTNPAEKLEEFKSKVEGETPKWLGKFLKDEEGVQALQAIITDKLSSD